MAKVDRLKISIYGTNKLNELIVLYLAQIVPQVKNYIGKKVLLASGKMSANFNIKIEDVVTESNEENYYLSIHRSSVYEKYKDKLVFSFSICLNNGGGAVYFDREVWLGRIDENGVLSVEENTATVEKIVTDYGFDQRVDFETEKAAILNYQTKQKEMEAAKSRVKLKDFINHVF